MSSYWIGPVQLLDSTSGASTLFEPQLTFTGTPTAQGLEPGVITGSTEWWQAHQLRELVNNPARRVTIGGQSGVLEPIYFSDPMLGPLTSWCLLQSFQLGQADQTHSLQGKTGLVPYTLTLAAIGDGTQRQVVVVRSARAKVNVYGFSGNSVVANPFWDEDAAGSEFVVSPGGTRITREYDASFPHSTPTLTPVTGKDRNLTVYTAAFSDSTDALALVVLPILQATASTPNWITDRGNDCRVYDRRDMREVYGPSQRFDHTTDLLVTNGLCRFWVGNKGLPAFLNVQVFASGSWREEGTVQLGTGDVGAVQTNTTTLLGARLVKVTPDAVTVCLVLKSFGDCFVTLKRGERMLRFASPAIVPTWTGTPPATRAVSAANNTGRFGNGLDGGGDQGTWAAPFPTWAGDSFHSWVGTRTEPDLRLAWPPFPDKTEWTRVLWYRPERSAVDANGAGFFTIYDDSSTPAARVYLDQGDTKFKFAIGAKIVASAAQTFSAGNDLMLAVRFSTTNGMALSVRSPAGSVAHIKDPTGIDPGTSGAYAEVAYLVNFGTFGDVSFGTGPFGGTTYYPDGVIDNDMLFDGWLTDAEIESLAAATHALDNLPSPEARLVWYAPFDAAPIVTLGAITGGKQIDPVTDSFGLQKMTGILNAARLESMAALARNSTAEHPTDQHQQFIGESNQQVRVR